MKSTIICRGSAYTSQSLVGLGISEPSRIPLLNQIDIQVPWTHHDIQNSFHKFSAQYHRIYRNTKLTSTCINMGGWFQTYGYPKMDGENNGKPYENG